MPRAGLDAETVTEAAATIIDAEGRSALTLARLAGDLGVAPPSLYKHVAGLDDLIRRVVALTLRRLTAELTEAALGRSGRQALGAIAAVWRRFAVEHTGLYALTQSDLRSYPSVESAEAARAIEILRALVRSYDIPDDRAVHAIRIVRAALHGFADIEARGGFQYPVSLDQSYGMLVDLLDTSLQRLGG